MSGIVVGYCGECQGPAIAAGAGSSVVVTHEPGYPALPRIAEAMCRACGKPIRMMSQIGTGFCCSRCEPVSNPRESGAEWLTKHVKQLRELHRDCDPVHCPWPRMTEDDINELIVTAFPDEAK